MNKPHFSYTAVFVLVLLTLLTGCNANTTPEASVVDNTPVSDAVIDYTLAGKANPEAVNRGVAYLQLQEDLSPADVEATLQYLHEHDRAEMHDEMIAKLESGEVECWSLFEDYLIMGDSRTVGISYYGFLPTEKVWAEAGKHIRNAAAMKDEVVAEAPANLFMCYGMNDCVAGIWDSPEDWANEYAVLVEDLHRSLPSTKIFLCSILPASE